MLRYTVLRLLIFFGCLLFFWLVGLRNDQILLLLVSAATSVLLSFFLLRSQRDRFSAQIADRLEKRQEAKRQAHGGRRPGLRRGRRGRRAGPPPRPLTPRFPASNPMYCQFPGCASRRNSRQRQVGSRRDAEVAGEPRQLSRTPVEFG